VNTDPGVATTDPDERSQRPFYWAVGSVIVAALWLRPIASSLWIDEFGTWWGIKDGAQQAIDRAWTYQGQSPLYYLLVWGTRHVTGDPEWALRLPSLVFALLSVSLVYRLMRRLVDVECARIAAVVFTAWPIIAFSSIDFRPYALATLLAIAATFAFVRWVDDADPWVGVLYAVLFAIVVYAHYLFAVMAIPHICYAIVRVRDGTSRVRPRSLIVTGLGALVLIAPLGIELGRLWARRETVAMPDGLSVDWVTTLLIPAGVVGAFVIGGGLAAVNGGRLLERVRISSADLILLVTWAAGTSAALIVATLSSPLGLQARYSLVWAPGAVCLVALGIRMFEPAMARRVVVLTLAVLAVLATGGAQHLDDWRGAMTAIDGRAGDRSVVLVQSGFVESVQLDWYSDPERVSYLGAPTSYYPVPGRVVVLPVAVAPAPDFARERILASMTGADKVLLVTTSVDLATWVDEVLHDQGWVQQRIVAGSPSVYEYAPPTGA
jgi:4-amino-4-deoxy-L-arabinose transferase-like glycosyltransferase